MNIRKYTENDFSQISSIYSKCKQEEFGGENSVFNFPCLEDDSRNHIEFIESDKYVYEGNSILGFITILRNSLGWLYVDPKCRNQGIGSKLIEFVLNTYDFPLSLKVVASNTKAISFYEKYGFVVQRSFETLIQERQVRILEMELKMANQHMDFTVDNDV